MKGTLPARRIETASFSGQLLEAWSAPGGRTLCYFLADGGAEDDRRAALDPGVRIEAGTDEEWVRRWEAGARLTVTERRVVDEAGEPWLVQNVGPVWAEESAAEGTGIQFRSLARADRTVVAGGGHVDRYDLERLVGLLAEALADAEAATPDRPDAS